jgi:hypothetical protein
LVSMQEAHVGKYRHNQLLRTRSFGYSLQSLKVHDASLSGAQGRLAAKCQQNVLGKQQKSEGQDLKSIGLNKDHQLNLKLASCEEVKGALKVRRSTSSLPCRAANCPKSREFGLVDAQQSQHHHPSNFWMARLLALQFKLVFPNLQ